MEYDNTIILSLPLLLLITIIQLPWHFKVSKSGFHMPFVSQVNVLLYAGANPGRH